MRLLKTGLNNNSENMSSFFQTTLIRPLEFGQSLEVRAHAEQDATWFNISLIAGQGDSDSNIDIVLHMLVSLNENIIAFKQCVKNKWKDIKSLEYEASKFVEPFKVNITVDDENFHIAINEEPCMFVKHIGTLEHINTLKINGHLKEIKQIEQHQHFPYTWPPIQLREELINFSNEQPIPFQPGHVIVIKIKLSGNEKGRLLIQFRNVWHITREELHLSIRFDSKKFVKNSKLPKPNSDELEFGIEECLERFPFEDFSKPFKLAIAFTESSFKIAKDGVFLCNYKYRTPDVASDVMGLKMFGTNGLKTHVFSVDHILLSDTQCYDFVKYSKLKYT